MWKISDVENGKEGNEGKLMEMMEKREIDCRTETMVGAKKKQVRMQASQRDMDSEISRQPKRQTARTS